MVDVKKYIVHVLLWHSAMFNLCISVLYDVIAIFMYRYMEDRDTCANFALVFWCSTTSNVYNCVFRYFMLSLKSTCKCIYGRCKEIHCPGKAE